MTYAGGQGVLVSTDKDTSEVESTQHICIKTFLFNSDSETNKTIPKLQTTHDT